MRSFQFSPRYIYLCFIVSGCASTFYNAQEHSIPLFFQNWMCENIFKTYLFETWVEVTICNLGFLEKIVTQPLIAYASWGKVSSPWRRVFNFRQNIHPWFYYCRRPETALAGLLFLRLLDFHIANRTKNA